MKVYNQDLMVSTIDSGNERQFCRRCNNLIDIYGKERFLATINNRISFKRFATSQNISITDIYYLVLKRFYLSGEKEDTIERALECADFLGIHEVLNENDTIRTKVFSVYIDTLNQTPHELIIKKLESTGYEQVNLTLSLMKKFYRDKTLVNENAKVKKLV